MRTLAWLVRRAVLVVVLAVAVAALDGCTHGVDDADSSVGASPSPVSSTADLEVVARVTRVAGTLSPKRRDHLAKVTRRLVGDYVRSALLDGDTKTAFTGFTRGAKRLAERDRRMLTLTHDDDTRVEPRRVAAYLDVLAPRGHMVGATARLEVRLRVVDAEGSHPVHLRGRLLLTPTPRGVEVFGYDLMRSGKAAS
jgi:hypothetical protein